MTRVTARNYNEARQENVIRKLVADNAQLKEQRGVLLAACEALLAFDWDTIFAEAGGVPYSEHYEWDEVLPGAKAAVAKAKGKI